MYLIFLTLYLVFLSVCFQKFGMNKPHMLFQISQRQNINLNFGCGYWKDNGKQMQKLRMRYENKNNGLYVVMEEHDGQLHIKQRIIDEKYKLNKLIKYQNLENNKWEVELIINKEQIESGKMYQLLYFTIQKSKQVNFTKYLKVNKQKGRTILNIFQNQKLIQKIFVNSSESQIQIYAKQFNTSQTWNIQYHSSQYIKLLQTQKQITNLTLLQNSQISKIISQNWNQSYTIVFIKLQINSSSYFHIQFNIESAQYAQFNQTYYQNQSKILINMYNQHPKKQLLKHIIFNLFGGTAYYYGSLFTQNILFNHQQTYVYSLTPSRLLFPRAFLWDDGFHMMVLLGKHYEKIIQFLDQWFNKIDIFGWIARQQIRGPQISDMMSLLKGFLYQDFFEANPPTLMLPIRYLIKNMPQNKDLICLLKKNLWKIQKWYKYFKITQSHYDLQQKQEQVIPLKYLEKRQDIKIKKIKYRWRCKNQCKYGNFMGSGLDDYPRKDEGRLSKQHVDLISWLFFFSQSLEIISKFLNHTKGIKYYKSEKEKFNQTLFNEYLDPLDNIFKDISVNQNNYKKQFVNHIGYINIFPFLTGMIPKNSKAFEAVYQLLNNQKILWSNDGIRSLSITDSLYNTLDNYWRGPVWIPINYLILRACKLYYSEQTIQFYQKLRTNLIDVIEKNYNQTGYLFENYHLGKGNRGFPFYGWSSLISVIILQIY